MLSEGRNILDTIKQRKANWIGHILRRNSLLNHVMERAIESTERRGRRPKLLLDGLRERECTVIWERKH